MAKKGEKILTQNRVKKLSLDEVSVITADMLKGYTSIGWNAFFGCSGLTSVTIPNSVTSIGEQAFYSCRSLTSVTIPNSVTSIGDHAFSNCSGLTSVTIPNSVTSIGYQAFSWCSGLTSINVASDNSNYCSVDGVLFNKDKTTLIQYPRSKQGAYTIPNSVTSIEVCAFRNCSGLISVTIPNSVTNIGYAVFSNCTGLKSVTVGDKEYKKYEITDGKCKAYKVFNANMTCLDFKYEEGETYELDGEPKLCKQGFHACLNLADVFNYYYGEIGKVIVVHEVELEGVSDKMRIDSKVVAKKITIGKRIL